MEEYRIPTLEELRAQKTALKAVGREAFAINTLINQCRPAAELEAEIASRRAEGKPTDQLEAELWMRENGIFGP